MAFQPGQSGNPGGKNPERERLRKWILEKFGEDSIKGIAELAMNAESAKVRLDAYIWLAEQAVGKATQPIAGDPENPLKLDIGSLAGKLRQAAGEDGK